MLKAFYIAAVLFYSTSNLSSHRSSIYQSFGDGPNWSFHSDISSNPPL